jgi:predicted ATPase
VTILAPGGMGKTRLALEVGMQTVFTDGVYFVDLAPLTAPEQIVAAAALAVGFQFYPGGEPKHQLLDFLRSKHLLLIMDNFEHVLDGAPLVTEMLQAAANLYVLATSREKLNLHGETVYGIGGLDLPETKTDAMSHAAVRHPHLPPG